MDLKTIDIKSKTPTGTSVKIRPRKVPISNIDSGNCFNRSFPTHSFRLLSGPNGKLAKLPYPNYKPIIYAAGHKFLLRLRKAQPGEIHNSPIVCNRYAKSKNINTFTDARRCPSEGILDAPKGQIPRNQSPIK